MAPQILHVLFEHACGYSLFRVKEFEEIGMLLPDVEAGMRDLAKFNSIVKLAAFAPFKSGTNALDNINSISEGVLHDDLRLFLETNIPKSTKKQKSIVGVADTRIGAAISEGMGLTAQHDEVITEIVRGIRLYFAKLIKGLNEQTSAKAQLGLGHSYSRCKVKFNVHRVDNMIIQSIALLDQLDKDVNTFSMRIREWYSYHFPELVKIVNDNYQYAKVAQFIKDRTTLDEDKSDGLEKIVMDSAKVKMIFDAARSSMGMDISPIDLINIDRFAKRVIALADYRVSLHIYLKEKMHAVAPNLSALIGEQVGARLISHAGSLTNLAKYPASTVQILGAEKALFRALKTRGNTPKYGLIFHSTFIGRAQTKNKGRISRYLANKCSIASRIDCFSDFPTSIFGEKMKKQVEDRLKFYETGDIPAKNVDVMKMAIDEVGEEIKLAKKEKKAKKKAKRSSKVDEDEEEEEETEVKVSPKKSKKRKSEAAEETPKKKKKSKDNDNDEVVRSSKKKKKSKD